ncbi:hypothetical protein BB561_003285 [Smittium simulii]|uniref:Acetyltransferase component of pyruvate dehydrogenase complex n=1 Tax=Smittium simulii TaxID=133385 RepID=A0A2T9YMD3_9FUNG|nr:hypothetical protein BB561_003285 [Smittium simulii]
MLLSTRISAQRATARLSNVCSRRLLSLIQAKAYSVSSRTGSVASQRSPYSLKNHAGLSALGYTGRFYSSSSYPEHIVVNMPALSPTMEMGNVGTWKKQIGDKLEPGDVLVEIETDKAQMDFEFQDYGYLAKILVDSGSKDVKIESPIAIVVDEESKVAAFANYTTPEASAPASTPEVSAAPSASEASLTPQSSETLKTQSLEAGSFESAQAGERIFASPLAKAIAKENDVSLLHIKGSGPNGRIVKVDVLSHIEKAKAQKQTAAQAVANETSAQTTPAAPASTPASQEPLSAGYTDIPLSNMRKVIASRLAESKSTIPHYVVSTQVSIDSMMKVRAALNEASEGRYKLTVNDFIVKAVGLSLKQVPAVNSSWRETFIRQNHHADIAIATSTPTGLITPIVTTCDAKGLETISNEVKSLAARAKVGKLAPHEYQGGSFTISNLGMYGVSSFTAIINPPHAAILSVGTSIPRMVPDESSEKGFRVVNEITFTLNSDHRVVDGATSAEFLQAFKKYLENPLTMLL